MLEFKIESSLDILLALIRSRIVMMMVDLALKHLLVLELLLLLKHQLLLTRTILVPSQVP